MIFELTNKQRKYLGLGQVEENWELVELFGKYVYFDGDIIRKEISCSENSYFECDLYEVTTDNRKFLLPKTSRGKIKKLNYTGTLSFKGIGTYFWFGSDYLHISNYTTQTTFYSESFENKDIEFLKIWLEKWISETTDEDLKQIEQFSNAKRTHQKYKEGDFFAFKIGRRNWGFGRILMDIPKWKKNNNIEKGQHYGLTHLMGKALIVKVYHKISESCDINLDELAKTDALPSQAIMDNHFFYGEYKIIGNKPLEIDELDMLISYSKSINSNDYNKVYLQYGVIYKEMDISRFDKYLTYEKDSYFSYSENPYRNEAIGFGLVTNCLEECIKQKSNDPFWNQERYDILFDLRNPKNKEIKDEIFLTFGLDGDKSYEENLRIAGII